MVHGKNSHELYRFSKGSSLLGFDPNRQRVDSRPGSLRQSLDMTHLNEMEESKYQRLNDHLTMAKRDRKVNFTHVRDNNANMHRVHEIKKKYLEAPLEDSSNQSKRGTWSKERSQMAPLKALLNIWDENKQQSRN